MRRAMGFWTLAATTALFGLAGCDLLGSKEKSTKTVETETAPKASAAEQRLCASNATYARLKETAFDEAKRIRERDTEQLDALADASVVRMENPLLESRDDALGLTVCSGRMVLELPPGAAAAFDGRQRLAADITYSAQAAADSSGTVYKMDGGEPIIYRLAGFDPRRAATRTASIAPGEPDSPVSSEPVPEPAAEVASLPAPAPVRPAPRPAARPVEREAAPAPPRPAAPPRAAPARRVEAPAPPARRAERIEPQRAASSARPSFNCRYARSRVEKMVCASDDLASRDREMASVFHRSNDASGPATRRRLSASRLRFLAARDRCGSEACVAAAYEDRMDEIREIADQSE